MSTWICVSTTKIAHATIAIEGILIVAGVKKGALGVAMTPDDAWCSTTTRGGGETKVALSESGWRSFAGRVRFPPVSFVCSFFFSSSRFDFGAIENRQSLALRDSGAPARGRGWQQRVWRESVL